MGDLEIIISVVTTLLAIVALQGKKMTFILIFQLILNALVVFQFYLSNNLSASYICALAIVQVIVLYPYQKRQKSFPVAVTVCFMVGYVALSLLAYTALYDLLTSAAACMFALSVVQKRPAVSRVFSLLNGTLWLVFDLLASAYTSLPVHITIFVAAVISIIRLDRGYWCEKFQRKSEEK